MAGVPSLFLSNWNSIIMNVSNSTTTESIFLLAILSSALIGTLMLIMMYLAIKGALHRQSMQMSQQNEQYTSLIARRRAQNAAMMRNGNNNNNNRTGAEDDADDDDYGTFGRRMKLFGNFTGSMASLQDAAVNSGNNDNNQTNNINKNKNTGSLPHTHSINSFSSPTTDEHSYSIDIGNTSDSYFNLPPSSIPTTSYVDTSTLTDNDDNNNQSNNDGGTQRQLTEQDLECRRIFSESLYLG